MNILVVSDDGRDALGFNILREIVRNRFPNSKVIEMVTSKPMSGQSLSIAPMDFEQIQYKKVGRVWEVVGKPADLIYLAFCKPEIFVNNGAFPLVVAGINHGANVGSDIIHSGTCGMMMLAATFGATGVAFSQDVPDLSESVEKGAFPLAGKVVTNFFDSIALIPGECWNINIPKGQTNFRGLKPVTVASCSLHRPWPSYMGKHTVGSDIEALKAGLVSIAELQLRVEPPLKY